MAKKYLEIRKVGLFYNAFDNDALIINYLLDYKIINGRCGFPINAIDKVLNLLDEKKINYKVDNDDIKQYKDNKYSLYLSKALNKNNIYESLLNIQKKIEMLDEEKVTDLLVKIEELVNEYWF